MSRGRSYAAALSIVAWASAAEAHAPDVSTARVTLRDEHVEVVAEWDLFPLVGRSPTELATMSEDELVRVHRELVATIERDTALTIDGTRRPLEVRGFPTPPELRGLAATLSASSHDHGARARIRLESREPVREARTLTLAAPPKAGPVNVSFVQPSQRYVRDGEPASFAILSPAKSASPVAPQDQGPTSQPASSPRAEERSGELPGLAVFFGGVAVGALLLRLFGTGSSSRMRTDTP